MYFIVTKVLHILFAFNVIISWNVHFVNNSVAFFCLSQKGLRLRIFSRAFASKHNFLENETFRESSATHCY